MVFVHPTEHRPSACCYLVTIDTQHIRKQGAVEETKTVQDCFNCNNLKHIQDMLKKHEETVQTDARMYPVWIRFRLLRDV